MIIKIDDSKAKELQSFFISKGISYDVYRDSYESFIQEECLNIFDELINDTKGELHDFLLNSNRKQISKIIAYELNKTDNKYDYESLIMLIKNMILYQYMENIAESFDLSNTNILLTEDITSEALLQMDSKEIDKKRHTVDYKDLNEKAIKEIRRVITLCMVSNYKKVSANQFTIKEIIGYRNCDEYNFYITKLI